GRHLRTGEGSRVRLPHLADGLLPRLSQRRRRTRRWPRNDERGRFGVDPDPRLQLHHHRGLFRHTMSAAPKIAIRGLKKAFGPKVVLDGVDLDVGVAESVVIIGGSGTGKSVLLKCILGLLT